MLFVSPGGADPGVACKPFSFNLVESALSGPAGLYLVVKERCSHINNATSMPKCSISLVNYYFIDSYSIVILISYVNRCYFVLSLFRAQPGSTVNYTH